jgi:hypothetical protein
MSQYLENAHIENMSISEYKMFQYRTHNILESSYEYTKYKKCIKDKIDDGMCTHYTPFTINDLIDVITNKYDKENLLVNEYTIAKAIMGLLSKDSIPYCIISKIRHYAIHINKINDYVYSKEEFEKYISFIKEYKDYFTEYQLEKLNKAYK